MDSNKPIALIFLIIIIIIVLQLIRGIFRILKNIWILLTGGKKSKDPRESEDWLVRATARQEIRIQNAMPPSTHEAKPQRKTWADKRREKRGISPTGWKFNEKTKMWEPPKKLKK